MPTRTPKDLKNDTQKAVQILELFTDPRKGRDMKMLIPASVLREAHGIVFIRLYRIGFMLSAKSGTGIIVARLPDGNWSAPSGVSMSSVGFGHQAGGEVIDSIIVMNYRAAVKAFFDGGGQLQLGVGASLAVGPLGRAAEVSASASNTSHIAATYAYSASKGFYIGYSFEGSKISERVNTNAAYYGRPIPARDILTGVVPPPQDAAKLYEMLNSLGAGPRPGLPFASQKDKLLSRNYTMTMQPPPPPPVNHSNRPYTTEDGFAEPPPPYQPNDGSPLQPQKEETAPPMDVNNTPFNQAYMNNLNRHPSFKSDTKEADNGKAPLSSYNSDISHNNSYFQPSSSSAPPQQQEKKPLPSEKETMTMVVAKYDYQSDAPSDLSFSAGDHIIVTKRLDDRQAWWEGEIGTKRGFFPANYTEELTDD